MELTQIGYFSKTHGVKGHLVLKLQADLDAEEAPALFVEVAGAKAPYFINEIKQSRGDLIVGLEEFDTIEKARVLVGKKVFADAQYVAVSGSDDQLLGFELIDHQYGSLGTIEEVNDNGQQLLVSIRYKGKEVILPLVEELIEKVDEEKKQLFYKAPEGLIEMYTGKTE